MDVDVLEVERRLREQRERLAAGEGRGELPSQELVHHEPRVVLGAVQLPEQHREAGDVHGAVPVGEHRVDLLAVGGVVDVVDLDAEQRAKTVPDLVYQNPNALVVADPVALVGDGGGRYLHGGDSGRRRLNLPPGGRRSSY